MADDRSGAWPWDGRRQSYRPAPDWRSRVSAGLAFHDDVAGDLDPVTYEVVRHRLWATNLAHGETITRISGSPIFQVLDFNMGILTEDGETVMDAPYQVYLDSGAPLAVRYILEHCSTDPGIEDGDMFLSNDPWIGAFHQMDVFIGCPVFVDSRLFAWVVNAGHQYDLGGVAAGGWPQNAVDIFFDPVVIPPIKIVERDHLRPDLEAAYVRHSRVPDVVALDLRAQIAGCRFARDQVRQACAEFGAATVKATMRRVVDNAEEALRAKLRRIPDGRWSAVYYLDEPMPGERRTQRVQLNVTKRGERLIVDNDGTDGQSDGPNGFTFTAFSGGVTGAVSVMMLYEQLFAIGGGARCVDFDPRPGLVTCVDHPGAVSGGAPNAVSHFHAAMALLSQMLACDAELRTDVLAPASDPLVVVVTGVDDRGRRFGSALLDALAQGSGARSMRDGVDTGGDAYCPVSRSPNVEEVERFYPVVYIYRDQVPDSGGAGRHRGGGALRLALTEYRSGSLGLLTNTGGVAACNVGYAGLMGGYPAPTTQCRVLTSTDIDGWFAKRRLPADVDSIGAQSSRALPGKSNHIVLRHGDVVEVRFSGGSGYGDPLEREPAAVADDVRDGWVSAITAERVYGVVLTGDRSVDGDATIHRRADLLAKRAAWRPVVTSVEAATTGTAATGADPVRVHEYLVARDDGDRRVLTCARCNTVVCDYTGNYKNGLLVDERPLMEVPLVGDPGRFHDEQFVFRRYCCPSCCVLMATETVRAGDPPIVDMRLAGP